MSSASQAAPACLGFYSAVDDPQQGLFGGYLVLDRGGRPLEFHCTAPLKPNRAQQILYGPTLRPFLLGEQIGQTLVRKAELAPALICVDAAEALELRRHIECPVVWVCNGMPAVDEARGDVPHTPDPWTARALRTVEAGRNRLVVEHAYAADLESATAVLEQLAESLDLLEPFGRIREALAEARRSAA